MLMAIKDFIYSITLLRSLFTNDQQPPYAPFIFFHNSIFFKQYAIDGLHSKLVALEISTINFLDHSIKRGAAKHVSDNGMFDKDIQKLER